MITFEFTARCGEQSTPLVVNLEYQPGNQTQRARRIAVGQLLAQLEPDEALVRAVAQDMVTVAVGADIWVIGEARGGPDRRGKV